MTDPTTSTPPMLGPIPDGMPDPGLTPPQIARSGDPFARLPYLLGMQAVARACRYRLL